MVAATATGRSLNEAVGFCASFLISSVPAAATRRASISGVSPSPSVTGGSGPRSGSSGR